MPLKPAKLEKFRNEVSNLEQPDENLIDTLGLLTLNKENIEYYRNFFELISLKISSRLKKIKIIERNLSSINENELNLYLKLKSDVSINIKYLEILKTKVSDYKFNLKRPKPTQVRDKYLPQNKLRHFNSYINEIFDDEDFRD